MKLVVVLYVGFVLVCVVEALAPATWMMAGAF